MMFYFIQYGFALEFRLFGVPQKIIFHWHPINFERGLIYFVLFGRWGDDPRSIIQIGSFGLEFAVYDYSGMVFLPIDNWDTYGPPVENEFREEGEGGYIKEDYYDEDAPRDT